MSTPQPGYARSPVEHGVGGSRREHRLKCWPEFFGAILAGTKTHDLRRADDRNFQIDDLVRLQEFNPDTEAYTGRELTVRITYITSAKMPCALSEEALHPDFCILSIQKI
jgi:hypothetical protein